MDLWLQDKVILVTGGAKGIGTAIVRACAAESAKVVRAGGNFDKLDAVVNAGVNDKFGLEHGSPTITLDHFSAVWCTTTVWPIMHCGI